MKLLLLVALLTLGSKAQIDPTNQLLNALTANSMLLQSLGTLTLNNNTFTQLIQVINGVFGSIQGTVVPYYTQQFSTLYANSKNLMNLANQAQVTITKNFNLNSAQIQAMDAAFSGLASNLGTELYNYQISALGILAGIQAQADSATKNIKAISDAIGQASNILTNSQTTYVQLVASQQSLEAQITGLKNSNKNHFAVDLDSVSASLVATALAYCMSYVYTFPTAFGAVPANLQSYLVAKTAPLASKQTTMDLVVVSVTVTDATYWICDRSYTSFNQVAGLTLEILA